MLKRKFDKILTHGTGSQLLLLLIVVTLFFGLFMLIAAILGWNYGWQEIIAMFLDPGGFGGSGEHDGFRLIVTLVGILLFSTLLISVFNNIFDNISESAKSGAMRYRVKNHILILGAKHQLMSMLEVLQEEHGKQDIVIMTRENVEKLSDEVNARFTEKRFLNRLVFYRSTWDSLEELKTAYPQYAEKIYIIGDRDTDSDSTNIRSCTLLKTLCEHSERKIYCYVMMENGSTIDMYMKSKQCLSTDKLKIDILNAREYAAEQVLSWTNFLPVIKADDQRFSHFVVLGTGGMAKAVAFIVAHNSHYPRWSDGSIRHTRITVIGEGMRSWMDHLAAARANLFKLSRTTYIAPDGREEKSLPQNDFLDVEWVFIDQSDASPMVRKMLKTWAADREYQALRLAICHEKQPDRIASLLHLPKIIYDKEHPTPICIYLEEGGETALRAMSSEAYGVIKPFGPALGSLSDPLFTNRSKRVALVNAVYNVGIDGVSGYDLEQAWYDGSEADKFASNYCSNALLFRWQNFDPLGDREPIYEAEHRRWMMSKLLMDLEHNCICPYNEVHEYKLNNFKNIINWMIDTYKEKGEFPKPEE